MVDDPAVPFRPAFPTSFALVLGLAACGSEGGDLDKVPASPPSVLGNGSRLSQLNDPKNPRPAHNAEVFVTGVSVVAVDGFDETGDGASAGNIYVQDAAINGAPPAYGGITLFDASFSPPSLRVAPGDMVDVRGAYQEFAGPSSSPFTEGETLPEIVGGSITLRLEASPPQPIDVPLAELAVYETGRKWIGMLVRVTNVTSAEDGVLSTAGRYSMKLVVPSGKPPTLTNALFDLGSSGVPLTAGQKYTSVVGVVQYFFNFSIAPRSVEDVQAEAL